MKRDVKYARSEVLGNAAVTPVGTVGKSSMVYANFMLGALLPDYLRIDDLEWAGYVSKFCTYFKLQFSRVCIVSQVIGGKVYRIGQVYFDRAKTVDMEQFVNGSYFDLYQIPYTDNEHKLSHTIVFQILPSSGKYVLSRKYPSVHLSAIPVNYNESHIYNILTPYCEFFHDEVLEDGSKTIIFGESFNSHFSFFTGQVKVKVKRFRAKLPKHLNSSDGAFLISVDNVTGYTKSDGKINFI